MCARAGKNNYGQCGRGVRTAVLYLGHNSPATLTSVSTVVAGGQFACATTQTGAVYCWVRAILLRWPFALVRSSLCSFLSLPRDRLAAPFPRTVCLPAFSDVARACFCYVPCVMFIQCTSDWLECLDGISLSLFRKVDSPHACYAFLSNPLLLCGLFARVHVRRVRTLMARLALGTIASPQMMGLWRVCLPLLPSPSCPLVSARSWLVRLVFPGLHSVCVCILWVFYCHLLWHRSLTEFGFCNSKCMDVSLLPNGFLFMHM